MENGIFYGHLVYYVVIWNIFPPFWYNLESLGKQNVGTFSAIWYILRPFGTFYGHLEHFTAIWYILVCCA
jgi:hypothetical protein